MVENVEETVKFYGDVLGFSAVATVPKENGGLVFAILVKDNLTIMAQDRESLIEEYPTLATPKVQPSITLYVQVENLEELCTDLKSKTTILVEPHDSPYQTREFAIRDNSGYVITFSQSAE